MSRYKPFMPEEANIYPDLSGGRLSHESEGLFFPDLMNDDALDVSRQQARELIVQGLDAPFLSYQQWVETGWKEKPGTHRAVRRFGDKAMEEVAEVGQALQELQEHSNDRQLMRERRDHFEEELGDVLFCLVAIASNSGVDLDRALKLSLYSYVMETRHFEGDREVTPRWHQFAGSLATKASPITVGDISLLIGRDRFEPTASPMRNILDPDEEDEYPEGHVMTLLYEAAALRARADQQFGRSDQEDEKEPQLVLGGFYSALGSEIGLIAAPAILRVAYVANQTAGINFANVISTNAKKISRRMATNTIDKADGARD